MRILLALAAISFALPQLGGQIAQASDPLAPPIILSGIHSIRLPDLDGDGVDDYAVSDSSEINPITQQHGVVRLIGSHSEMVLATYWGGLSPSHYGHAMATGDYNGDGSPDIVIASCSGPSPYLAIVDLSTHVLIDTILAPTSLPTSNGSLSLFATSVALHDVDGDGMDDVMATSLLSGLTMSSGIVQIFAGGTGALTYTLWDSTISSFGKHARFLDDVNGDGIPEVLVTSPGAAVASNANHGHFGVYDIISGTAVYAAFGVSAGDSLGEAVIVLEDVDADGVRDFALSQRLAGSAGPQNLTVHSGFNGAVISTANTTAVLLPLDAGTTVPDLDGDGKCEIAVQTMITLNFSPVPYVDIYSSATLRHLDHIPAPTGLFIQGPGFTVMPDLDGNGYSELLVYTYQSPTNPGPLTRIPTGAVLDPSAAGNHPLQEELLRVNATSGAPARRVDLQVNEPFHVSFQSDSTAVGPTDFIIFGMIGEPGPQSSYVSPFGTFVLPPRPAFPGLPWLFTLADSIGFDPAALFTPGPASYLLDAPQGVFFPVRFTLQGVSITNGGTGITLTNAVLIDVHG